ncbi:MAG: hypothetical protein PWP46_650 [Fusobacteriaceae bacterium]|nr:hypothetical protein [Fusobacteriales bacterium]MDN5303771.1 hypothetical protein [Fusobacteriaceae bacterium]
MSSEKNLKYVQSKTKIFRVNPVVSKILSGPSGFLRVLCVTKNPCNLSYFLKENNESCARIYPVVSKKYKTLCISVFSKSLC